MDNSNQLLHFLTAATSNLQEALSKPCNGKKVNHRRYIQKRLQKREPTNTASTSNNKTKKTKSSATPLQGPICNNNIRPHPIAAMNNTSYWSLPPQQHVPYYPIQQHVLPPMASITPPLSNSSSSSSLHSGGNLSRPHSTQPPTSYDDNLESLLTEIGLENTPQYNSVDMPPTTSSNTLSRHSSLNTVHWDTYLPPNEFIPSPHSDFSDVDDSAYSSPSGPSSVNNYYPNIQQVCSPPNTTVSMTTTSCYHHVATGSCEWLPSHNTPVTMPTTGTPSFINMTTTNLAVPSSLNDILELVTP